MDMRSVKCNRTFDPLAAGKQMKMFHNAKWEDRTSTQESHGTYSRIDMLDNKQDCVTANDASKNMIMKSSQGSTKGNIRTRLGWIKHRPEKEGIDS